MNNKSNTSNNLGTYLLGGALFVGGISYANAQDTSKVNADSPKVFIYGTQELTAAGDGIFAKSYINEVSPDNEYSLKSKFSSKDKIKYFVTDAKKGLEKIARNMGDDSTLTGKEKAFKHYIIGLAGKLKSNDKASLRLLNAAVKDGVISPENDSLYNEKGWQVKDSVYLVFARTKRQSVPVLLSFKPKISKLEKEAGETEEPFMRMNEDTLCLLKDYSELTIEQKRKWNKLAIEHIEKGFKRVRLGMLIRPEEEEEELPAKFGLEAGIGTNQEAVAGIFVEVPLTSWLSTEGFVNGYVARGNIGACNQSTEITIRPRELIGPATYKQRTDEITTFTKEKTLMDMGVGLTFKVDYDFEFPLRIGVNCTDERKTLEGKSTIIHERNDKLLGQPKIITNSKDGGVICKNNPYFSAGARANIINDLSVGASFERVGRKNGGRISLRVAF